MKEIHKKKKTFGYSQNKSYFMKEKKKRKEKIFEILLNFKFCESKNQILT